MGYHRAGFDVVGVDIKPQPHYPFEFHQGDALEYCAAQGGEFDVIHASPPCQRYSVETPMAFRSNHADLIAPVRNIMIATGKPYVIENVTNARRILVNPLMLCGSMFGLGVWRHRWFEVSCGLVMSPRTCNHSNIPVLVTGTPRRRGYPRVDPPIAARRDAMGIDWMVTSEIDQAIPPAYTKYIGAQLMRALGVGR